MSMPAPAKSLAFDPEQCLAFLRAVIDPGTCTELRVLGAAYERGFIVKGTQYSRVFGGWYNDPHNLKVDASRLRGVSGYVTPNPVTPALLSRSDNALMKLERGQGTSMENVVCLRWMLLDVDSEREDGISATHEELAHALALRDAVLADYPELLSSAMWGCSGNGGWILVRLADLPNDDEHKALVARVLAGLSRRYTTPLAKIDEKTKDPSRIMCLPGTMKCKGSNRAERPWRPVTLDSPEGSAGRPIDVRAFLAKVEADAPPPVAAAATNGAARRPDPDPSPGDRTTLIRRAAAYLASKPGAVAGNRGHDETFDAACILIKGFDLTVDEARPLLAAYSTRCDPPWSDREIDHKLESATTKPDGEPRGYLARAERNGYGGAPANGYPGPGGPAGYAVQPGVNGHRHAQGPPHVVAIDLDQLRETAEGFTKTAAHRLEVLYLAEDFLVDLAEVERTNPPAAEAIKAVLRRIPGFVSRPFEKVMGAARARVARDMKAARAQAAPDPDRVAHEFTDLGNGRRLVDMHGHRIRHCKAYGDWMIYDGRRWTKDELYEIESMAQEVPRQVLMEIPATPDEAVIEAHKKWSTMSQSRDRLDAMTRTARSMLAVTPDQLDRDPWLLNVENGTIDLKTGEFREHRPGDLVTKIAAVAYDPDAKAERWEAFVLEIMGGDVELADYLRRAVGYSITGVIREHVLFFLYGSGRNGKTVMLNTLFGTLGDYANEIDSDLLISQNFAQHPTGLTELEGRRMVAADEADDGRRLAEAQVKKLTGGNPIQARRMGKDFYTFRPTHHLFFAANHKPEIRGMDAGIWRRIKLIPFEVAFDLGVKGGRKPDLELESKLVAERSGILNWMLRGCREWQEHGLDEPAVIRRVVQDYQSEMDVLGSFIEETCVPDADARVVLGPLYDEYKRWGEANNIAPLSKRKFSAQLGDRSFKTLKSNSTVFKVGLRLKSTEERHKEIQEAYEASGGVGRAVGAGGDMWANGRGDGDMGDIGGKNDDWTRRS